jgi:hypothetical protein
MDSFAEGMDKGMAQAMNDILNPLADAISDPKIFGAVKEDVASVFEDIAKNGEVSVDKVNKILAKIDAGVADPKIAGLLKDQLKSQIALQESGAKIAAIKEEIAEAEAAGFIPAELKAKLKAAEEEQGLIADTIDVQDELLKAQEIGAKDFEKAQKSAMGGVGAAAGAAAAKSKKAFAQSYQEELALLEDKFARGLISEEEFLKKRIKLEEKWFDSVENMDKDATADRILEMRAQLEALGDGTGVITGGSIIGVSPGEGAVSLFPSQEQIAAGASDVGETTAEELTSEFGTNVNSALDTLKTNISMRLGSLFETPAGTAGVGAAIFGAEGGLGARLGTLWESTVQPVLDGWAGSFWDWIDQAIIDLPANLTELVTALTTALEGVNTSIQNATSPSWIDSIFAWINEAALKAGERLLALLLAFAAWAASSEAQQALTDLGTQLGELLMTGLLALVENQQRIHEIMVQLIVGLAGAIAAITGILIVIGGQIIAGIISGMLKKIGVDLRPALFSELSGILSGIATNIGIIVKKDFKEVGFFIANGLSFGLIGAIPQLKEAFKVMIEDGVDAVYEFLGIDSPSTLFMQIGIDVIQGLIDGIVSLAGQVGEVLTGIFATLFGGGEGEAEGGTEQFAQIIAGGVELETILTATFDVIRLNWATAVTTMGTDWTLFTTNITLSLTAFSGFFKIKIDTFTLWWTTFTTKMKTMWLTAVTAMQNAFQAFADLVMSLIRQILDILQELIDKFYELADTIEEVTDRTTEAVEESIKVLEELSTLLDTLEEKYRDLERAAEAAAQAVRDVGAIPTDEGGAAPPAQHGAWRTREGLYMLHDDELIAPARIADQIRSLIESMRGVNFGGFGDIPHVSIPPVSSTIGDTFEGANAGIGDRDIAIYNTINDRLDLELVVNRIIQEIGRRI